MTRPAKNQLLLLAEAAIYCKVCGRRLRSHASRQRGMGAKCLLARRRAVPQTEIKNL